jgi:hypothetical protein
MLRAEGPKIAGGALLLSRFFKQLFPRKGGSAPLSFKRRPQGRPILPSFAGLTRESCTVKRDGRNDPRIKSKD